MRRDLLPAPRVETCRGLATPPAGSPHPPVDKIVAESETVLDGLPAGAGYTIAMTARNAAGGESAPGLTSQAVVP